MSRFPLRTQLWLLSCGLAAGLLFFGIGTWKTLNETRIGSPAYERVVMYKDLVADILPPPNYIIESYLTSRLLADPEQQERQQVLVSKLKQLRTEYEERHRFWLTQTLPDEIKTTFLQTAHEPAIAFFQLAQEQLVPLVQAGRFGEAHGVLKQLEVLYEKHRAAIDQVVVLARTESDQVEVDTQAVLARDAWSLGVTFVLSCLVALVVNLWFGRSLRAGVTQVETVLNEMGQGNFSLHVQHDREDELGRVLDAANSTARQLRTTIGNVLQIASSVTASASQLSQSMHEIAGSTEQQTESVTSVAATVEEMSTGIAQMAAASNASHARATDAGNACERGSTEIHATVSEVEKLASDVQGTAVSINRLGAASSEISTIIQAIREIADQTNLLALNAAIEAARAGEQGRGFAVVADEVRKLAERTASSTDQISSMIAQIQQGINQAVTGMSEGSERARSSVDVVQRASATMADIAGGTQELLREINEIATALDIQRVGSGSIASEIERIAAASESNGEATRQITSTAKILSDDAQRLRQAVSAFRC